MDNMLVIGRIINTHGLKGEVKVEPLCDSIDEILDLEETAIDGVMHEVLKARAYKSFAYITLSGIDNIDTARKFVGKYVYAERRALSEGQYYLADLLGMTVINRGTPIGKMCDFIQTGANDVYIVKGSDGKQILFPAIKDVIKEIDLEGRIMRIEYED